jgi:hypothetical protein
MGVNHEKRVGLGFEGFFTGGGKTGWTYHAVMPRRAITLRVLIISFISRE